MNEYQTAKIEKCPMCHGTAHGKYEEVIAMRNELLALREQLRWRKYPEEKPEFAGRYWAMLKTGDTYCLWYEDERWVEESGIDVDFTDQVAKWCYLPEPPKEEK